MITLKNPNKRGHRQRFRKNAVETTYDYRLGLVVKNVVLVLQRSCSPFEAKAEAIRRSLFARRNTGMRLV